MATQTATTSTRAPSNRSDRQTTEPAGQPTEQAVIAALVVLLLADLPEPELAARARALLIPLGLSAAAVDTAVALVGSRALSAPTGGGDAVRHVVRTGVARRAAYLVAAGRRLSEAEEQGTPTVALRAERRYLAQHLAAERTRVQAAGRVDVAAAEHGPILGWYAKQDAITSRACRRAHGRNYRADRPPVLPASEEGHRVVGFPGTPHGGACRCVPGRPWPGGVLMPPG